MHDFSAWSDEQLVESTRQGSSAAFGELVRRHSKRVRTVALALLRNGHDAEDAVQNAFQRALEHVSDIQDPSRFGGWLVRIVANECYWHRRCVRRYPEASAAESMSIASPDGDAEGETVRTQTLQIVRREACRLPRALRDPLVLVCLEQRSLDEASAKLGVTRAAVKGRLHRAKRELRCRLARHGITGLTHLHSAPKAACGRTCVPAD